MSEEILRIDGLKASAEQAAESGRSVAVCPYDDPRRVEMWKTFYYAAIEKKLKEEAA